MRKLASYFNRHADILVCWDQNSTNYISSHHTKKQNTCCSQTTKCCSRVDVMKLACVFAGGLLSAVCGGLSWSGLLAAALWSRTSAREHQEAAAVTVWAPGGVGLRYQKHRWGCVCVDILTPCLPILNAALRNRASVNIFFSSSSSDRGNDNWLIKYEKPGEEAEGDEKKVRSNPPVLKVWPDSPQSTFSPSWNADTS